MRRVSAFQSSCCDPDLDWTCELCDGISCFRHDPSPGENAGICDLCYNPADHQQESE